MTAKIWGHKCWNWSHCVHCWQSASKHEMPHVIGETCRGPQLCQFLANLNKLGPFETTMMCSTKRKYLKVHENTLLKYYGDHPHLSSVLHHSSIRRICFWALPRLHCLLESTVLKWQFSEDEITNTHSEWTQNKPHVSPTTQKVL